MARRAGRSGGRQVLLKQLEQVHVLGRLGQAEEPHEPSGVFRGGLLRRQDGPRQRHGLNGVHRVRAADQHGVGGEVGIEQAVQLFGVRDGRPKVLVWRGRDEQLEPVAGVDQDDRNVQTLEGFFDLLRHRQRQVPLLLAGILGVLAVGLHTAREHAAGDEVGRPGGLALGELPGAPGVQFGRHRGWVEGDQRVVGSFGVGYLREQFHGGVEILRTKEATVVQAHAHLGDTALSFMPSEETLQERHQAVLARLRIEVIGGLSFYFTHHLLLRCLGRSSRRPVQTGRQYKTLWALSGINGRAVRHATPQVRLLVGSGRPDMQSLR